MPDPSPHDLHAEPGLCVELLLPYRLEDRATEEEDPVQDTLRLGNRLLLRAINQMEAPSHDPEATRGTERLEAKLDLMLHWLGQTLYSPTPRPAKARLWVDREGVEWEERGGALDNRGGLLWLYPHAGLAAPLCLPVRLSQSPGGRRRAAFMEQDDEFMEAWGQWLFRQHRRAIHAAREGRPRR